MPYGPTKFVNGPEPGRRAGEHAGAGQRHPGDLPGGVRVGQAGVPDAGVTRGRAMRRRSARRPAASAGGEPGSDTARLPIVRVDGSRIAACGSFRDDTLQPCSPHHPRPGDPQRAADRRGLRAGRARADADLRRAAHHQLRAWRAAHRRDVRGVLRAPAARARSLSRGARPDAAVLRASAMRCSASSSARPRMARTATSCWSRSASRSSSRTRCSTRSAPTRAPSTCPTASAWSRSARRSSACRA